MKNSDGLYISLWTFQGKRKAIMDKYEQGMKDLEDKKGSAYYRQQSAKLKQERDDNLKAVQAEYSADTAETLQAMNQANSRRGTKAPTTDQINILNALKMRDNVTEAELDSAANAVSDNALCLSVISEIALKNGVLKSYQTRYTGKDLPVSYVTKDLKDMAASVKEFLQYDTTHASRLASEYMMRHTGSTVEAKKRPLFDSKESCYSELFGMNGDQLQTFCDAVDGSAETGK